MPDDLRKILTEAETIAAGAARILMEGWGTRPTFQLKSRDHDLVTEYDRRAEEHVVGALKAAFPGDAIVGEEGSRIGSAGAERVWYVDPLDGTTNFAHGLPLFCVSIGLAWGGEPVVGVLDAPAVGWRFSGAKGCGSTRNGAAIAPSAVATVKESLLVTGFPYTADPRANLDEFAAFMGVSQGMRRLGSAALDLGFVACGWLDGYWERHIKPWDLVGGAAIVRAAGGTVTDLDGGRFDGETGRVLATNGRIHDEMRAVLERVARETGDEWP